MQRLEIKKGDRFGQLTVIKEVEKIGTYRAFQLRCDCGNRNYVVKLNHLRRTLMPVRSCGCLREIPYAKTHGQTGKPTYKTWLGMKKRCQNQRDKNYPNYGGRGIKLCERWQKFESFFDDMGERPSIKHEIDRIDNDGNYEPGNVRWVTRQGHARNKRKQRNTQSCFRGVDPHKWRARIMIDGEIINLGLFNTEEEAARAYDAEASKYGFPLNFEEQDQ